MTGKKQFLYSLAVYVGTIIGVGLFGMPYVGSKSGFITLFFYLIIIGAVVITINIFYGEITSKTKGLHRLPGYAQMYLGDKSKIVAFIVKTLAIFGALLAYLIIGGQFLSNLFGGSEYLFTFIFFIIGAFLIWKDKKSIGPVEFILLFIFLLAILLIFFTGLSHIEFDNLLNFEGGNLFVPYGVVLFSLWGASIIPEIKEELKGDFKKIRKVIICGISICILVYLLFSLLVIGVSGGATSQDALSGLEGTLGQWVLAVGYIFGIIATFTSFIALGLTVKKLFWYDYKLSKKLGWALACLIPLALYIFGLQNFIEVIGLTGAVMLGMDGILVTLIYIQFKKTENSSKVKLINLFGKVLIFLLALGVVLEFVYFFKGF